MQMSMCSMNVCTNTNAPHLSRTGVCQRKSSINAGTSSHIFLCLFVCYFSPQMIRCFMMKCLVMKLDTRCSFWPPFHEMDQTRTRPAQVMIPPEVQFKGSYFCLMVVRCRHKDNSNPLIHMNTKLRQFAVLRNRPLRVMASSPHQNA